MCKILLSINPEYVQKIFDGTKKYEYRKVKCKRDVDKIIIYETSPVMKIVGEASVKKILEDTPEKMWQKTKEFSGTSSDFFLKYYSGRENAIAYELKDIKKYDKPQNLSDYGITTAPQSFVYIS